jgi:uncharacterized protein YegL
MELDFGSSYARRLPVYFLIGTGNSMRGNPIQTVEEGMRELHGELLSQPQAVEQVWMSVITFASNANQVSPLTTITQFSIPALSAGGSYNLGQGLQTLIRAAECEIEPTTAEKKGDYRPLTFLIFDNNPTDRWEKELAALESARNEKKLGSLIAIGLGEQVNLAVLRQLTESVLWMAELKPDPLHAFFRWTSASLTTVSHSVAIFPNDVAIPLPAPPNGCKIII